MINDDDRDNFWVLVTSPYVYQIKEESMVFKHYLKQLK